MKTYFRLFKLHALIFSAAMLIAANGASKVNSKVIEDLDGFTVVGISVRTNNAKESTPDGAIGKQWQRFFKDGILNQIPDKAGNDIVAVYTDYASDKDGDYTYVLGAKVSSAKNIPAGMAAIKVPGGRYAMFTSGKGATYKVVPAVWQGIWALPKSEPGGNRAYKTDFEIYDQRAADPENAQVDVYIGLK